MSASNSEPSSNNGGMITRRQLLQWVPGIAAAATFGSASPALALAASPDAVSPSSPTASQVLSLDASALDLPFRAAAEATADCAQRRKSLGCDNAPAASPLEVILQGTSLANSRLGLGNWPLLDETEDPHLGHFTFPISPFNITADNGTEEFLLFSNNQLIANFRYGDYLEEIQRRMSDRAIWAMRQGRIGTAIVEFERPITPQKVDRIVKMLAYYGVRSIVWGNELNDPNTPWRDDLPTLFDILSTAAAVKKRYGLTAVDLSLPGMAFYGNGEYLQKMLTTFKDLQRKKYPSSPNDLPVQRAADHYYGSVDGLLQRIRTMRGIIASEGVTQLKYDLTEMGNPTLQPGQPRASDQQLAEGYIPQAASIAIGSGQVDTICFYSLLDIDDGYSLMQVQNGHLIKKPSYQAFIVTAKLLAGLKTLSVTDQADMVRVDGRRNDGIAFQIVWSKRTDQNIWTNLPSGARAFDAMGQEVKEDRAGQIVLGQRQHPALGGPARIIITQ